MSSRFDLITREDAQFLRILDNVRSSNMPELSKQEFNTYLARAQKIIKKTNYMTTNTTMDLKPKILLTYNEYLIIKPMVALSPWKYFALATICRIYKIITGMDISSGLLQELISYNANEIPKSAEVYINNFMVNFGRKITMLEIYTEDQEQYVNCFTELGIRNKLNDIVLCHTQISSIDYYWVQKNDIQHEEFNF